MKKLFFLLFSIILFTNSVSAFDLSQEITSKGGIIKIDEKLTLDVESQTFPSNINFTALTVNDIDGWTDSSKYEDKNFGAFKLDFTLKTWSWIIENSKALKLTVIWLDSYKNPILLKSNSWTIEEIAWKDDLGSFVFSIEKNPSASYKIVEKKTGSNSASVTGATITSEAHSLEPSNTTALDSTSTALTQTWAESISLDSKDTKWVNSILLFVLILIWTVVTLATKKFIFN